MTRRVYVSEIEGGNARGRPPPKWRDRVQEYVRERGERYLRNIEQARRECLVQGFSTIIYPLPHFSHLPSLITPHIKLHHIPHNTQPHQTRPATPHITPSLAFHHITPCYTSHPTTPYYIFFFFFTEKEAAKGRTKKTYKKKPAMLLLLYSNRSGQKERSIS